MSHSNRKAVVSTSPTNSGSLVIAVWQFVLIGGFIGAIFFDGIGPVAGGFLGLHAVTMFGIYGLAS